MRHSPIKPVSSISASSDSGAIAAQLQAQAEQYANDFTQLQKSIGVGDISGSKKALAVFIKDTTAAASNGFDPVNQNSAVRQSFATVRSAVASGDISAAQTAFLELRKNLQSAAKEAAPVRAAVKTVQSAVQAGDIATAKAFASELAASGASSTNPVGSGAVLPQDIRALQQALQSGDSDSAEGALAMVQMDLNAVIQNNPQLKPGTPAQSQFAGTQGVVQSLGTLPSGTDAASAIQAYTLAIQQGIQTAKTDPASSSGYLVKAASEVYS